MLSKKINLPLIISILGLVISVVVLLFGNNLLERFKGPKIVLDTTKIELNFPSKLEQAISDYAVKKQEPFLPDYIRVVNFRNDGSNPSRNLRLLIKLDGDIYQYDINCTESIIEKKQDGSDTLNIYLSRLSKNANIELKVWIKNKNTPFKATYADDVDSGEVSTVNNKDEAFSLLYKVMIIILIASLILLLIQVYYIIMNRFKEQGEKQNKELIDILTDLIMDNVDNEEKLEDPELVVTDVINKERIKNRLEEFTKKYR